MRRGRKQWFDGVLHIPEATIGEFAITHVVKAPGDRVPTSNFRVAMFRGQDAPDVTYPYATVWHQLSEGGGVWMTSFPIEQIQHDEELKGFQGTVLVGGLGLGYAATALAAKSRVTKITVVERSAEIIELVAPHIAHPKIEVVHGDLFEFLTEAVANHRRFRYGFYDIWQSDSEYTFHHVVMPLRRLSSGVVNQVTCWNESVMRSQLFMGLQSRLMFTMDPGLVRLAQVQEGPVRMTLEQLADGVDASEPGAVFLNWSKPFFQWVVEEKPTLERAQVAARDYAIYYGIAPTHFLTHVLLR